MREKQPPHAPLALWISHCSMHEAGNFGNATNEPFRPKTYRWYHALGYGSKLSRTVRRPLIGATQKLTYPLRFQQMSPGRKSERPLSQP
jgi:hypothetical protein